jgi:hypothetical protein
MKNNNQQITLPLKVIIFIYLLFSSGGRRLKDVTNDQSSDFNPTRIFEKVERQMTAQG